MLPLCLGVDPGATSGISLVEPRVEQRPRLMLLRIIPAGLDADAWAERAFRAFEAVVSAADGRPVVGWYEQTIPPPGNGWMGAAALNITRGKLLAHASDAGLQLSRIEHVMVQTWTSILGVPRKKLGDGSHRIAEAERLVEMPETTFRGLGAGTIDGAEGVLMAGARAYRELGIKAEKPKPARKPGRGKA